MPGAEGVSSPPERASGLVAEEFRELIDRLESSSKATGILDANGWVKRGNAYAEVEDWPAAAASFERALALRPFDKYALFNRAYVLQRADQNQDAFLAYDRYLQVEPNDPDALNNRGIVLTALNRYDDALADFDRSLKLRPDRASTYYNRACVLALQGARDDAFAALKQAIELGYSNVEIACGDEELKSLHHDPRFEALFHCSEVES